MKTHFTEGQPPRAHGSALWKYGQKRQRVPSVPLSGGSCGLWYPGWDSKDLAVSLERSPTDTARHIRHV